MGELRALDGQLDWNDVRRYVLAVTQRRTLAGAAAAALGVDQSTAQDLAKFIAARFRG